MPLKTYSVDIRVRRIYKLTGLICMGYEIYFLLTRKFHAFPPSTFAFWFLFVLGLLLYFWMDQQVTLGEDYLIVKEWFRVKHIQRDEIKGFRVVSGGSRGRIVPFYLLYLRNGKRVSLSPFLKEDKEFKSWFDGLPRLEKSG